MWRTAEGGGGGSGREGNGSPEEWSLFPQLVYLFLQAAIDVLFKVVWVTAARRPGFRDLAKATITSTPPPRKAELD